MLKDLDANVVSSPATSTTKENTCGGCGDSIKDRYYLLAADKAWHGHCLRCSRCTQSLDTELSCFCRGGSIYCKDCRKFSSRQCAKCDQVLRCDDLVMRARDLIFHLNCFSCSLCKVALNSGDTAALQGGQLFCGDHVEDLQQQKFQGDDESHESFYCATPQKGRPRKKKCSPQPPSEIGLSLTHPSLLLIDQNHPGPGNGPAEMGTELRLDLGPGDLHHSMLDPSSSYDGSSQSPTSMVGCMNPHSRAKRMRTSFKHNQLRSMKSYFAINQNPDAKDLKNLAQKTGLSKRVLQVWFQNARAKWRRNMMRQEQQNGGGGAGKSLMGLLLPNLSSVQSVNTIVNDNFHGIRNGGMESGDISCGDYRAESSSPSVNSSMEDINHLTFAELF